MEHYSTHSLHTWQAKNKKCRDMIDLIKRYNNIIIQDKIGLDAFLAEIKMLTDKVNAKYPKQKELVYSRHGEFDRNFSVLVGYGWVDDAVFQLTISRAAGIYHFNEKLCTELSDADMNYKEEKILMEEGI